MSRQFFESYCYIINRLNPIKIIMLELITYNSNKYSINDNEIIRKIIATHNNSFNNNIK